MIYSPAWWGQVLVSHYPAETWDFQLGFKQGSAAWSINTRLCGFAQIYIDVWYIIPII